jgi:hypothetical protein
VFEQLEPRQLLATWSGTLADGTVWGATPGEVEVVSGTVTVPEGATLTIRPGTIVKFSFSAGELNVAGQWAKNQPSNGFKTPTSASEGSEAKSLFALRASIIRS